MKTSYSFYFPTRSQDSKVKINIVCPINFVIVIGKNNHSEQSLGKTSFTIFVCASVANNVKVLTRLDEVICHLQNFSGVKVNNSRIRCLAYADDLELLARTREDGERMVEAVRQFLCSRGIDLNAAKSSMLCFCAAPIKKKRR